MTGNELAKAISNVNGKIAIQMFSPYQIAPWLHVSKKELKSWAKSVGDDETRMALYQEADGKNYYLALEE